jgi:hypothetical protein
MATSLIWILGRFMDGILIGFASLNWELTNTFLGAY